MGGYVPGLQWQLNERAGEPLFLQKDGTETYKIVAKPISPYQALTRQEYKDYGIPSQAILAAYSWYAGYGDVIYVLRQPAAIEVYRREMDESETSRFPDRKIYTIPR